MPNRSKELQEAIRKRAREIWEESGRIPGRDSQNWLRAEEDVLRAWTPRQRSQPAIQVRVGEKIYTATYDPGLAGGYIPGEFKPGDPVELRFEAGELFLKRRSGQEFQARIIRIEDNKAS